MDFIGADEAKTHLPRLLDEVAAGRSYTITKHGVPVARLLPAGRAAARPEEVIRELREGVALASQNTKLCRAAEASGIPLLG